MRDYLDMNPYAIIEKMKSMVSLFMVPLLRKTVISTRFVSLFKASMVSMLMTYILSFTDNVVAGQFMGEDAVAAMTIVTPLTVLLAFVSFLISDGLAMMVSYAQGNEDAGEVNRLFSLGIIFSIINGLLFTWILVSFQDELLSFWRISDHLMGYASRYYSGLMFIPIIFFLNVFIYTIFIAEGKENYCVLAASAQFISNIVLDLILCNFMGTFGIGIATVIGTLASLLIQIYYLTGERSQLQFHWYWDTKKILQNLLYSFYHSVGVLCLSILPVSLSAYVINRFGEENLIVVTIGVNILSLIISIYIGLIDCLKPMICQYYAENNLKSIEKTMNLGVNVCIIISVALTLLGIVFADFLPVLYGVENSDKVALIATAMRYWLFFTVFLGCSCVYSNHYIYIDRMKYGAMLKILLLLVFPYIGMYIGGKYSINGMWLGVGSAFFVAFAFNYFFIKFYKSDYTLLLLEKRRLKKQLSYDIDCTVDKVMQLTSKANDDLMNLGMEDFLRNKVILFMEELGLNAVERSHNKPFQIEFSVILHDDGKVILCIRDNGEPYNIIENANKADFREFFIESVTAKLEKKTFWVGGDENRLVLRL